MMHVLMSAYQCGPGMGSVSQIGWEWYSRMTRAAKVTLVTHIRNKRALESVGAPLRNSEVVYVDTEHLAGPLYRTAQRLFPRSEHAVFLVSSADYFFYDRRAVAMLHRMRPERDWDVAHQVTPVSPLAATRLHTLGCPVVLGPWNGGLETPSQFPELLRQDSAWVYRLREAGHLANRINESTRNAALILSANSTTDRQIPEADRPRVSRLIENGVEFGWFRPVPWRTRPSAKQPVQLLFVGRLIPFKALHLLIEALARVKERQPVELTVAGDGPMRAEWEALAARHLGERVRFLGNCSIDEVGRQLQQCHALCLPSVRESGGAVILEAMAAARPAIVVDYGGPSEVVDETVGRAIPALGSEAVIQGFQQAVLELAEAPDVWEQKGLNGRRKAESEYSWEAKIEHTHGLYESMTKQSVLMEAA
jgi:alpha-maltose-1-phosphate synthase